MNLSVGLIAQGAMWEQLLKQEGVPFDYAPLDSQLESRAVLIINRDLSDTEQRRIEAYLDSGGAVLGSAEYLRRVCGTMSRSERLEYLVSDHDEIFPDVSLMDASILAHIPREANCLRTQENTFAVFAGKLGGGYAVILPFDIAAAMRDARAANKNFYSVLERLPTERVSLVAKGEMRRLLHGALEYLFHARNLPYAHVWYFPQGVKNVFAFRIDSDKGSRNEIDALYEVARDNDVRMSWFLDVKSHEDWLQHFAFLSGQDMGVHCYEHRVFDDFEANLKNITAAKRKLDDASISASGFSAPYGMWNAGLAKAIDQIGFEYSSEFSYAYDCLPFYPSMGDHTFGALQVPVHPICIGSLRRVGYTESQMKEYFRRVIDEKLLHNDPLFFYHHPTHHCWEVMECIFRCIKEKGIENITLLEYARWWKKRLASSFTCTFENSRLIVNSEKPSEDTVWLRVSRSSNEEAIVPLACDIVARDIDLHALPWKVRTRAAVPADIRRIREFDPRSKMGELITSLTRKFTERRVR